MQTCKYCGFSAVPDGSLYCNMCGKQIRRNRSRKKTTVKVPEPKALAHGYYIRMMVAGQQHYITARTPEECTAKAIAIKTGIISAPPTQCKTLGQLMDDYINSGRSTWSPATLSTCLSVRHNRYHDYIDTPANRITNWQAVIDAEIANGLHPNTIHQNWKFLLRSLSFGGVDAPAVKLPKTVKTSKKYLTPDQIKVLVSAVDDSPAGIGTLLGLHGLRRSEIFDVSWDDIDLEKNIIHVRGAAVVSPNGQLVHKSTNKNISSQRDVPIMIPELRKVLEISARSARYVVPCNTAYVGFLLRYVNDTCQRCGLPLVGVHGLRHSFASLAYHLGIPMEHTCKLGGWANTKTVMAVYTHLYDADVLQNQNKMIDFYTLPPATEQ